MADRARPAPSPLDAFSHQSDAPGTSPPGTVPPPPSARPPAAHEPDPVEPPEPRSGGDNSVSSPAAGQGGQRTLAAQLEAVRQESKAALKAQAAELAKEADARLKAEREAAREDLTQAIADVASRYEGALAAARAELEEAQTAHAAEIEALKKEYARTDGGHPAPPLGAPLPTAIESPPAEAPAGTMHGSDDLSPDDELPSTRTLMFWAVLIAGPVGALIGWLITFVWLG